MVPDSELTLPDTAAIRRDLEFMTARWGELTEPAMLEVRGFKEGAQPVLLKFAADWIDQAVDSIEEINARGYNMYVRPFGG